MSWKSWLNDDLCRFGKDSKVFRFMPVSLTLPRFSEDSEVIYINKSRLIISEQYDNHKRSISVTQIWILQQPQQRKQGITMTTAKAIEAIIVIPIP